VVAGALGAAGVVVDGGIAAAGAEESTGILPLITHELVSLSGKKWSNLPIAQPRASKTMAPRVQ